MRIGILVFFLFFMASCQVSKNSKKAPKDTCQSHKECPKYSLCVESKCKDYVQHNFASIEELNQLAVSRFMIISDNKGDAMEDARFKQMEAWRKQYGADFIIGLGDHVKINWPNAFLSFLKENTFWYEHFYPNIADGENEYYGASQGDWGAGKKLLEHLDFHKRKNSIVNSSGAEYYSTFSIQGMTIHLIQLHFPDTPRDANVAWPESSREYLMHTLDSIEKTENDIIIVGAHSIVGEWHKELKKEHFDKVMEKVDLGLSATSHIFAHYEVEGHKHDGPLFINTGAITRPRLENGEGFVYVFVLENPTRIVLQYIDPRKEKLTFDERYPMYIKTVKGYLEEKPLDKK